MKASELISAFEEMYDEGWSYALGAAKHGCVDCSGAFVYAFKLHSQTIPHGSNSIARQSVTGILPIGSAKPGYAAFKRRDDGGEPDKFKTDGLGNFYHIGLVSRDGRHVLNAKGEKWGFCLDDISSGWTDCGALKGVQYGEEGESGAGEEAMEALYRAQVATSDDPLNIRNAPVSGKVIGHAPRGAHVYVLRNTGDGWPRIRYNDIVGYASGQYLQRLDEPNECAPQDAEEVQGMSGGVVIVDSAGNRFVPVGGFHVLIGAVD